MRIWQREASLTWRELAWPRPLSTQDGVARLRALVDDPTVPFVVLELRADNGRIRYLLGAPSFQVDHVLQLLDVTGASVDVDQLRPRIMTARELTLSARDQPLDTADPVTSARLILRALGQAAQPGERLILQLLLGPRLRATTVNGRSEVGFSWEQFRFVEQPVDAATKAARNEKTSLPGFRCMVGVGVTAGTAALRRQLALGLLGALKRLETPGLRLDYRPLRPERLGNGATVIFPLRWPLRLNAAETAAVCALPVGDGEYPGLPGMHPKPVAATEESTRVDGDHILAARSTAPATLDRLLTRSTDALLHHLHILGPTGTGKSVALLNLALQDMQAGRSVVVVEPKGDLVEDLLSRIPVEREADVVVFDPLNSNGIIGLNPLSGSGSPELRADTVYGIFRDLFGDSLGVRTSDLLHAGLLTLARQPDASLVQLPLLYSDTRFRRRLTIQVMGDLALAPFWTWYESLKDGERTGVIAPLMNKLRALILNPVIRRVIGQTKPRFHVEQVFSEHRILLAALPVDRLGEQGASLLGSLLISRLWDAARNRASLPAASRTPAAAVYVDEAQKFLHLGADLGDILATSRSYGVGWTLAHQYLGQLGNDLRSAVLANCRSRISFQPSREDAETLSKLSDSQLMPEDFTSLPAYHIYASLYAHGQVQPYVSGRTLPAPAAGNNPLRLHAESAQRYGRSAAEIETQFTAWQHTETHDATDNERIGVRRRGDHA